MKPKRVIPVFKSEAEEARWWDENRARLDQRTLKARLAASKARMVSIRLPEADIQLARKQAAQKGLPYQTYMKSLLHQSLRQAE